jgi:hypothetical protein
MAQNDEWEDLTPAQAGTGTVAADDEAGGGWETLSGNSAKEPAQEQSLGQYLLGRASKGVAGLGAASAYSTAVGPGGAFAADPVAPELMMTAEQQQAAMGIAPPQEKGQGVIPRYLGTGLEAVFDPLSYALGPVSPAAAGFNFLTGVTAEAGGDVGGAIESGFTGSESGFGRVVGNITGGLAGAPTQGVARYGTDVVGDVFSQVKSKVSGQKFDPSEVENLLAAKSARNFLEEGAKAGGKDYNTMINDFRDISQFVLGTDAPLMLQAASNPVFKEELIRLAKTDPSKKAALEAEFQRVATAIDRKSTALFGSRYGAIPASAPLDVRNVRKRIDQIDGQITKLTDPFLIPEDKTDLGAAITNLVDAKQKLIKREMSPRYESLKQAARDQGLTINPEATEALHTFVKQNRLLDIFGRQTDPEKKISSLLSPRQVEGVDILKAERTSRPEYKALSFDDVDSLKRLVNDQQRKVRDPAQQKKLQDFEDFLNGVRDKYVPPEFNDALKSLDKEYYQRLGIPFGEEGVREISGKKYAAQVAPVILKNKDSYQDFIDVAGEQGKQVAEKAMISKAYDSVIKDGIVNPNALRDFVKKNSEVLSLMPNVQGMMSNTLVAEKQLRQAKAGLEAGYAAAQKRIADNWFTGTQSSRGVEFGQLVDSAFSNSNTRAKLVRDLADLSPEASAAVRESLRAEVVNKAKNNPQGGFAFLTDPRNKLTLDVLLGKGYQENLKKVLKLSDAVAKSDIKNVNLAIDLQKNLDPLAKLFPGLDTQTTVSTIRRPIVSGVQKGVILYSRISQARAQNAFDDMSFSVLTDPNAVKKLANVTQDLELDIKNPVTLKDAASSLIEAIPARTYISLSATTDTPEKRNVTPDDIQFIQQYTR